MILKTSFFIQTTVQNSYPIIFMYFMIIFLTPTLFPENSICYIPNTNESKHSLESHGLLNCYSDYCSKLCHQLRYDFFTEYFPRLTATISIVVTLKSNTVTTQPTTLQ